MFKSRKYTCLSVLGVSLAIASCNVPKGTQQTENRSVPQAFNQPIDTIAVGSSDTTNSSLIKWREFFTDKDLVNLIDTALVHNQELMMTLQEIEIAKNDVRFRHSALLPTVGARVGAGVEKVGRYTSQGAGDASTEITPGKEVPDPLADFGLSLYSSWEADIWSKLHNAKKAAIERYLATMEGRNFVITNLVAEVANSYYELLALDNQLAIVRQNIELQKNALEVVKIQKEATKATELAVQKFQAEVLKSQSLEYDLLQDVRETENRLNFLLGRFPQEIPRDKSNFLALLPSPVKTGIPAQLLENRPDIKQAELELVAAKLDVKVARAEFYPSVGISAAVGFQAFKPSYLFRFPESLLYSLTADLVTPLINKNAIKAEFNSANARQLQAMYNYERTILNAYLEVANELSKISNLDKSFDLKSRQVDALTKSIDISTDLFRNARADYLEVLMTQRDALEAKLEVIETKKQQLAAVVNVYRGLGGGWK
ncbi:NodT family efflux transporter outer membrane factor (OMF) lipoprotein [Chitinophaga skermanii]|uniref:NodT family efflux transporter outer membrane factor (OMF) lipoprotein n=1 Tax=Chitinophaga skermanii TaxID=331697 RepID=A0A327R3Z9_9BACT|nr:TolC family protein [Chitinophaga skermanii]RAJ10504.1 NodT family efflux transporter outer membrane factor (OMF) lipoprotein [Chitinophaga skermanii]